MEAHGCHATNWCNLAGLVAAQAADRRAGSCEPSRKLRECLQESDVYDQPNMLIARSMLLWKLCPARPVCVATRCDGCGHWKHPREMAELRPGGRWDAFAGLCENCRRCERSR